MSAAVLEVAANSVASALAAQCGGAARVELCAALELGGLTPSHATIRLALERLAIPAHVLIRPRAGDFLYDDIEFDTMLGDIRACASMGCAGVVVGALDAQGDVDMARGRELVAAAGDMHVTFHRAIDMTRDPQRALEDIIALGCKRILTSGTRADAQAGAATIRQLVVQADRRIAIMPGGGIDPNNIAQIAAQTGARDFHASARQRLPGGMRFRPPALPDMIEGEWRTDVDRVRDMVRALQACAVPGAT